MLQSSAHCKPPSSAANDYLLELLLAQSKSIYKRYEVNDEPLPSGWRWVEVGEVADPVCRGIAPKYADDTDQIILGQTCIRNNLVILENGRTHQPRRITEKWLRYGDLLINSTGVGSLGRTAQVWFEPENLVVDSHITIVRSIDPALSLYLGFWAFAHERYIESLHVGSTGQTELPRDHVKTIRIVLPDDETLREFNSIAQPATESIVANQRESKRLEALRDTLLPRLMSGEIDVSEVELSTQPNNHLRLHTPIPDRMTPSSPLKGFMMENVINLVLTQMQPILESTQLKRLAEVLRLALNPRRDTEVDLLRSFLTAKEVEGCSQRTIVYYRSTIQHMVETIAKPFTQVDSDDLRRYLADYETTRKTGKVTIDNIRRILSSFFSWLEDEDYIVKSPVRRIHKVKTATVARDVLSDEDLETLRDSCSNVRDLTIVDMLASTGMRIGELVNLNIPDIDLQERECIVTGKGNKQRPVYFDARTKLHLQAYLNTRQDDCPALFVSLDSSATRLSIGGVETRLRNLGKASGVGRVHPHKFRRTLATHAIDKGMPIEQVQKLLGHARIDTTMYYAMVNQNNVKASHRKYLE